QLWRRGLAADPLPVAAGPPLPQGLHQLRPAAGTGPQLRSPANGDRSGLHRADPAGAVLGSLWPRPGGDPVYVECGWPCRRVGLYWRERLERGCYRPARGDGQGIGEEPEIVTVTVE